VLHDDNKTKTPSSHYNYIIKIPFDTAVVRAITLYASEHNLIANNTIKKFTGSAIYIDTVEKSTMPVHTIQAINILSRIIHRCSNTNVQYGITMGSNCMNAATIKYNKTN